MAIAVILAILVVAAGYLIGSLPMGYFTVKLFRQKDITQIGSGRTGGTNAMRAGGVPIGIMTMILDGVKGFVAVLLARWLFPDSLWIQIFAGAAAVLGHNWSIWLYLLTGHLSAGAGTGPNVGAAIAFWPGIALIAIPIIAGFVFIVGYASLASIATAVAIIIAFFIRYQFQGTPYQYWLYGILTLFLVVMALRSNIRALINGTERRVGIFAKKNPSQ